ncbi:MAG: ATP-binding protein [Maricaulaceae bacterium]
MLELEQSGRPVDGMELIGNLIYAFDKWRDYETADKLAAILLRLEAKNGTKTPGFVQLRAARSAKNLGRYAEALSIAQTGITVSRVDVITDYLRIVEIEAYAGLGEIKKAEKKLVKLETTLTNSGSGLNFESQTRYARALIAASKGDAKTALSLMKNVADTDVQNLLRNNNNNTASLLANLENNKERQQERAAATKREAELLQKQLEEQVKSTRLFLTVAIMFGFMAVMAAIFALYRNRTNKHLAKSAEAALAGEKAKTQFLAVMSHELRTPLNGILGIADMLTETAPTPELRSQIGIINDSGNDLLRLVEQILDMSRLDAEELEIHPDTTDVRKIIHRVDMKWRAGIVKKGITFTSHIEADVPDNIIIDPLRLEQCISNLVSNAGRFTDEGRIHMHVTARKASEDVIVKEDEKRDRLSDAEAVDLRIIVADTGMGMTPEVQSRLFQPFIQADSTSKREFGGSGLGLAITSSLADMMNGSINVNSRKGGGSEFTLRFRCPLDHPEKINAEIEAKTIKLKNTPRDPEQDAIALEELSNVFSALPEIERRSDAERHERRKANHSQTPVNLREIADLKLNLKKLGLHILVIDETRSETDIKAAFPLLNELNLSCVSDPILAETVMETPYDIICVSVTGADAVGLPHIETLRQSALEISELPLLALTEETTTDINAACMKAGANLFLPTPIDPSKLAEALEFLSGSIQGQLDMDMPARSGTRYAN